MIKKNDKFLIKETTNDVILSFIRHTVDTSKCIFVCHNVTWRLIDMLKMRYDNNYIFAIMELDYDT